MLDNKLRQEIMRRVYFVYLARKFARPIIWEAAGIFSCLILVYFYVSLRNVYHNVPNPSHFKELFAFFVTAFLKTEIIVQGAFLVVTALSTLLARQVFQNIHPITSVRMLRIFGRRTAA